MKSSSSSSSSSRSQLNNNSQVVIAIFLSVTAIHAYHYSPEKPTALFRTRNNYNYNTIMEQQQRRQRTTTTILSLSDTNDYNSDWDNDNDDDNEKWEEDSSWSSFAESNDDEDVNTILSNDNNDDDDTTIMNNNNDETTFLNTIASISADEINFMNYEADRADKVRQMEEWGFEATTIANTLDVAMEEPISSDNDLYKQFQQEDFGMYNDAADEDLHTVESHTTVEVDEETGEPIRSQMVYVDEHTCIGCTNCATVAQSTFFMEDEMGRARVFEQWGDDDETIQIAIETCPVDCIHYVPYEELKTLEVQRRSQSINFKARLVSQAEYGGGQNHMTGGGAATGFTAAPLISSNLGSRCNNCPSRGCRNCPMYGVGKNPIFEQKEKVRLERAAQRRIRRKDQKINRRETKSAEL